MEELFVIFGFVLIVMLVFVLPITIYAIRTEHQKKMAEVSADKEGGRIPALEAELEKVNARLEVLERIVTDGRYDLNQEIRRLESADA